MIEHDPSRPRPRDLISRAGAERLARELDHFWHSRGHPEVRHWTVPLQRKLAGLPAVDPPPELAAEDRGGPIWCVRSNLIAGLPPPPLVPR